MNWYLKALKQYADFSGRSGRTEFWMFVLFYLIFGFIARLFDNHFRLFLIESHTGFFSLAYSLAMIVPFFAVTVRRLHDIGKSGWWILINLIPFIGTIWLIILLLNKSQMGVNEYGENQ
jgi:uncharacterized membrane protein YhaH (DUF805 family)